MKLLKILICTVINFISNDFILPSETQVVVREKIYERKRFKNNRYIKY